MSESTASKGGCWFSRNPEKAWGEKFFLCYIPYFFLVNGLKPAFGWMNVGNLWHVLQNLALLLPLVLVPMLLGNHRKFGVGLFQTYTFRLTVWMFTYNFVATYFLTEYFFDVLGMVYDFPKVTLYLDSALLGSGEYRVPVGMYLNAPAFFAVYHTIAILMMRRVLTMNLGALKPLFTVLTVLAVAYLMAYLETKLVANDANAPYFMYKDLPSMLQYGSMFYACYFIPSFPIVFRLQEQSGEGWPLSRVIFEALAAGMLAFILVDFATHYLRSISFAIGGAA